MNPVWSRLERARAQSPVRHSLAVGCVFVLSHCNHPSPHGGQTGDGSGVIPPSPDVIITAERRCSTVTTLWNDDLQSVIPELGFSPKLVLDRVSEGVNESLLWAPDGNVVTAPEEGEGQLLITFTYDGGEIRVVHPESNEQMADAGDAAVIGPDLGCTHALEIEVLARVTTLGGSLNESVAVTLSAVDSATVSFGGSLPLEKLSGALTVTSSETWETLRVWGVLTDSGSSGLLLVSRGNEASEPSDEAIVSEERTLAVWPNHAD